MSPPIYYGGDRLSLSGIDKVYYGSDLVYSQNEGPDYLKFTATQNGSTVGIVNTSNQPDIQVNVNGTGWQDWDYSTIDLDNGEWVKMRGDNPLGFSRVFNQYSTFAVTGSVAGSGNIMTLIDMTGETDTIPCDYCFGSIFSGATGLTSAPDFPAVNLTSGCYYMAFANSGVVTPMSELPARSVPASAYFGMFNKASHLATPPQIGSPSMSNYSMAMMFAQSGIHVTDRSSFGPSGTWFFTCASTSGLTQPVEGMFAGTGTVITPVAGTSYYYYEA